MADASDDLTPLSALTAGKCDLLAPGVLGGAARALLTAVLLRADPAPVEDGEITVATLDPAKALVVDGFAVASLSPAGLRFNGVFHDLLPGDASVDGWLFDVPATPARPADRHVALKIAPPAGLTPEGWLAAYSRLPAGVASFFSNNPDFALAKLAFAGGGFLFSSVDFSDPDARVAPDPAFAPPAKGPPGAGLRFEAQLTLADAVAGLFALISPTSPWRVAALIAAPPQGLTLTLQPEFDAPSVTLHGFSLTFDAIRLGLRLAALGQDYPEVGIDGKLGVSGAQVAISAQLDLAAWRLDVVTTQAFALPDLGAVESLLGLENIAGDFLPPTGAGYGAVTLGRVSLGVDFDPPGLANLSFALGLEKPVTLLPGVASVAPVLEVALAYPGDKSARSADVALSGRWFLGDTTLVTYLSLSDKTFSAHMPVGQGLDISAALDAILPGVQLPARSLELVDLELSADWGAKSFDAEIDFGSDWTFSVAGAPLAVTALRLQMSYAEGAVTNCEISGHFLVAGLDLDALAIYEGGHWTLRAATQTGEAISLTRLGALLARDLGAAALDFSDTPNEFLDVAVKDLFLEHRTGGAGSTTFYGSLANSIDIGAFRLDQLFLRIDASADGLAFQAQAMLRIADAALFLSAKKQGGSWLFEGGLPDDATLSVGELIADMTTKFRFDVPVPEALRDLRLKALKVSYSHPDGSFSVAGAFVEAASSFAALARHGGASADGLPSLPAAAFSFSHNPKQRAFSLSFDDDPARVWRLDPFAPKKLRLDFVETVTATPQAQSEWKMSVAAQVELSDLSLDAAIAYDAGWSVEVGLDAGAGGVSPATLLAKAAQTFGFTLPRVLDEVALESVSARCVSATGEKSVSIAGRLHVGRGLHLVLTLDGKAEVKGTLTLGKPGGGFDLDFTATGQGASAKWSANTQKGQADVDLADLLGLPAPARRVRLTLIDIAYESAA